MSKTNFSLDSLIDAMNSSMEKSASEGSSLSADPTASAATSTATSTAPVASEVLSLGNTGQVKTAAEIGASVAREILSKQAAVGDVTTFDGIPGDVVPNKVQASNAALVAQSDAATQEMPTSDGNGATGSVNEIYDSLIADSQADGAASVEQVHGQGVADKEDIVSDRVIPAQVKAAALNDLMSQGYDYDSAALAVQVESARLEDQMQKAAAVEYLMNEQGVSFDDAVQMVKSASEEIQAEQENMEKAAALHALMTEDGLAFEEAVSLIKQAAVGDVTTFDGIPGDVVPNKVQASNAALVAQSDAATQEMPTSDGNGATGSVNEIYDSLIADSMADGAASVEQVHDQGVADKENIVSDRVIPAQVKAAALNDLVSQGFDFMEAAMAIEKQAAESPAAAMDALRAAGGLIGAAARWPGRAAVHVGRGVASAGREAAGAASALVNPAQHLASGMTEKEIRMAAAKSLLKNPLTIAGAAAGAGAGAAAIGMKKKAAVERLMSQHGMDFDTAVSLVDQKSRQLFGA